MKTAILLTVNENVDEIYELCRSADINILASIIQKRKFPEPNTYFGKGKMEDVKNIIQELKIDLIVFNGDLKPNQHYSLETFLKMKCIDRIGIILDIFTSRAQEDRQASLQVEMARLHYEMPTIREWVNRQKTGEHPGFLSSGEYSTEGYLNFIYTRQKKINEELLKIESDIDRRVIARKNKGFHLVSLCGHTNAGKSSLMSVLSLEEVYVKDLMFSTLSTTTRKMKGTKKEILISDTIGFLRDLPPFMINSFKSTLSEIFLADLVLLLVDGSESQNEILAKIDASLSILFPEVKPENLILVVNKVDVASKDLYATMMRISLICPSLTIIPISIHGKMGLDVLKKKIEEFFNPPCSLFIRFPLEVQTAPFVSWLYDNAEVISVRYDKDLSIDLLCHENRVNMIYDAANKLDGTVVRVHAPD